MPVGVSDVLMSTVPGVLFYLAVEGCSASCLESDCVRFD